MGVQTQPFSFKKEKPWMGKERVGENPPGPTNFLFSRLQ